MQVRTIPTPLSRWSLGSSWHTPVVIAVAVVATAVLVYSVLEQDRHVKANRTTRAAAREALHLIRQVQHEKKAITHEITQLRQVLAQQAAHVDDKEWTRRDKVLVRCNELLLQLMERLDAVSPRAAIVGEHHHGAKLDAAQEAAIRDLRAKKKKVIREIEQDFLRLDQCRHLLGHQ
ncbi:hypothetical protein BC940DRAFT_306239 [Gongronella butleri]|nr:hypothetical protein BC940DRAFT_306239 [Gongronella butleri]